MQGTLRVSCKKGHERRGHEGVLEVFEEKPQGVKAQEGIGRQCGLTIALIATDRCLDQRPVGEAARLGAGEFTRR